MTTPATNSHPADLTTHSTHVLGFYVAILTTVTGVVTFAIAILTPPPAGPWCTGDCYFYPYLDVAVRFPRDYLWMVPAIVLTLIYVVLMVCIHRYVAPAQKVFSQSGLSFALIAATLLVADYFVQLSVIQPSLELGETDGIALLTQFNPHGLFIALEEIGYLLMSLAFLFMAPVFSGANRIERALRWIFVLSFVLTLLSLVLLSVVYGVYREYRFEVAAISINWLVLIVAGALLSLLFRRAMRTPV